jgi:hypothetical protein
MQMRSRVKFLFAQHTWARAQQEEEEEEEEEKVGRTQDKHFKSHQFSFGLIKTKEIRKHIGICTYTYIYISLILCPSPLSFLFLITLIEFDLIARRQDVHTEAVATSLEQHRVLLVDNLSI